MQKEETAHFIRAIINETKSVFIQININSIILTINKHKFDTYKFKHWMVKKRIG